MAEEVYKRYMVFEYNMYYPNGGLEDAVPNGWDTLEEATHDCRNSVADFAQVFDRVKGMVVFRKRGNSE